MVNAEGMAAWTHNHFYAYRAVRPMWSYRAVEAEIIGGHKFLTLAPLRWRR